MWTIKVSYPQLDLNLISKFENIIKEEFDYPALFLLK